MTTLGDLPFPLRFALTKPTGFPSYIRNTTFTPSTIYNDLQLNDTVRFEIKSKAFLDPYSIMINIDVACDQTKFPPFFMQKLDQSAHSLFTEMTISSKGTVLEHIQEYDTLASVLHDMNYSAQQRRSRAYEGHADSEYGFRTEAEGFMNSDMTNKTRLGTASTANTQQTFYDPLCVNACWDINSRFTGVGAFGVEHLAFTNNFTLPNEIAITGTTAKYGSTQYTTAIPSCLDNLSAIGSNIALTNLANKIFNTTTGTVDANALNVWRFEQVQQFTPVEAYEPADTIVNESQIRCIVHSVIGATTYAPTSAQKMQYTGYTNPRVTSFAECASGEPFFCGVGVQLLEMYRGQPRRLINGRNYLTFSVPLLSAFFGVLLPPDMFKYIPLSGFDELVIELKFNQYAFYTSGYTDSLTPSGGQAGIPIPQADHSNLAMTQMPRQWTIKKIEINCDLISFDSRVEQLIDATMSGPDGIILQSACWCLGPQYQFSSTQAVQGTYQINMGFNSLKSFFFVFTPLDYLSYTFCRKQFRLSHNLTKFYLTIGQDQFPQDGIKGHGGQPWGTADTNYLSNKTFMINMYKSFNKLHDMRGNTVLTPYNFAVNNRAFDPTKKGYYLQVAQIVDLKNAASNPNPPYVATLATIPDPGNTEKLWMWHANTHTALGLPMFHETRVIGKAIYGLDCETMTNDFSVLSGLNTIDFKPFNLVLEVDSQKNQFTRDSRLNIFFYYDCVIQLKKGQFPIVSGRQ